MSLTTCSITASRSADCSTQRDRELRSCGRRSLFSYVERSADEWMQNDDDAQHQMISVCTTRSGTMALVRGDTWTRWLPFSTFLPVSVSLFVFSYVNTITQKLLIKSLWNCTVWLHIHTPWTNRLDFNGNPDLDLDSEIFEGILPLPYWLN